jgi:hypothetical protein
MPGPGEQLVPASSIMVPRGLVGTTACEAATGREVE